MTNPDHVPFEIGVEQLAAWLDEGLDVRLLDVREPREHAYCRLEGARLVPMREIPRSLDEIDGKALTVVYCHHGVRSAQVVSYLRHEGFERVTSLAGGIDAWSLRVDPSVPRY